LWQNRRIYDTGMHPFHAFQAANFPQLNGRKKAPGAVFGAPPDCPMMGS
jgi:hypothetical protein